jgi:predicted type IV restriction endonuclease
LLEVKAIGSELKDQHVKQAVDYAANQGVEWVGLSNGCVWRMYKVQFAKPIAHEAVLEVDLLALNHRAKDHVDMLALLSKECWVKERMSEYYEQKQALSRFTIGALLVSDPVLDVVRRDLRRVAGVRVEQDEVRAVLQNEVIKREVLEGEKAASAARRVTRAGNRQLRKNLETSAAADSDTRAVAAMGAASPESTV